jgi:2-dehydro-3-deoxyphosphogluconate aldolase/(4S)-4-hydroxy-2-oxoglutarate aldolase
MKLKKAVLNSILTQGMLPLFFYEDVEVSLQIIRTLYGAGVRVMEYTNRAKPAFENFKMLRKAVDKEMADLYLGIGTIKNISDAEAFVDAGADFIVAPTINPEVGKVARKHKLLWIPGCMTPTEIYAAQIHGAELVKIFPANVVGPGFISAVKEIFPDILFMPTGGVELTPENINGWFNSGVSALGMGGKLISKDILNNRLYDQLHTNTVTGLELIKAAK